MASKPIHEFLVAPRKRRESVGEAARKDGDLDISAVIRLYAQTPS